MSSTNETNVSAAAADLPQPAPTLAPEVVVAQLRALRAQIGEVSPLTTEQRKQLQSRTRATTPVLQASINAIGASDNVSSAVGSPAIDVRQKLEESGRWTAVEDELRAMLNGIAGANLIRRHEIELLAAQGYNISKQLVRNPAHAALVPHVQEIKRLKGISRRKKATQPTVPPATPVPPAPPTPHV